VRTNVRAGLTFVVLSVALLSLPEAVWAQVRYEMLTVAEAAYLYSGLAAQRLLRNSGLKQLPQVIVVCGIIWLVYQRVTSVRPQPVAGIVAYAISCTLILVLFWPEAVPRFGAMVVPVNMYTVESYVAKENSMPVVNAQQSGMVPQRLRRRNRTRVPRALDLLLQVATTVPLTLGRAMNGGLDRPFERVQPMKEFVEDVESGPPPSVGKDMSNFATLCYEPAMQSLMEADPDRTFDDVMPWSAAMSAQLASIPMAMSGPGPRNCSELYQNMENAAVAWLTAQTTAQGSSKGQVVEDSLDISVRDQARIFVQRALEKEVLEVQPANHVVAAKRALEGLSSGIGIVGNFEVLAPFRSTATQLQKHIDRMARFLGIGAFLVYWGPYLVGLAMFAVLAFFPVVLLWSLFPGQHFKPLVNYFLLLIFVCSTPLWWAMVDAAAEVAYAQHPTGGWFDGPAGWGLAYTSYMVVTVLGIIMVPLLQATLLFGSWRAIGGIWNG
jgi:hypothetical protein